MNNKHKAFQISALLLILLVALVITSSRGCPKRNRDRAGGSSGTVFLINTPSNLTATAISYIRVDISWTDNALNNDGYAMERKESAGGTWIEIIRVGDVSSYSDTGPFLLFTTYYYRVRAYNGLGDYSDYSNEVGIIPSPPPLWTDIAAGNIHTLGRSTNRMLWAWGLNTAGQLGLGDNIDRNTPTLIQYDLNWNTFAGIDLFAAGYGHTIARQTNGTIWSWGLNDSGQLGLGDTESANVPFPIGSDSDWAKVATGYSHSLALKTNATLWVWGRNDFGQLGLGYTTISTTGITVPIPVNNDSDWSMLGAGSSHTVAIKTNFTLWTWGYNLYGQLGDGTTIDNWTTRQIGSTSDWLKITTGEYHTIAIKTNSTLWAWGLNKYGQLGLGDSWEGTDRNTPTQIGNNSNWSMIAGGFGHTIAIKTNATLWSWGQNNFGQLGLGDSGDGTQRTTPMQIGTNSNWSTLAAVVRQSFAIKTNSTLWAWGWNQYNQLGLGDTISRNLPTLVGE